MSIAAKDGGREAAQRFVFEFRSNPEILAFVNGKEIARYSQQGPVTPDHAIRTKNLPLRRAGAGSRQARRLQEGHQGRAREIRRRLSRLFRALQRQADRGEEGARSGPARRAGAGRRPVRRRQYVEGRQDRRRSRRDHGRGDRRCRAARHLSVHSRAGHLRHRVLVARAGQAKRRGREASGASHRRRHRRRLGHRCGDRMPRSPRKAPRSWSSTATSRR